MRPPSGSAAMALAVGLSFGAGFSPPSGFSSDDCAAKTAEAMLQLVETRSPRCGLIKFGISLALLLSARKNNCALPDLSLYGEFLSSSIPFCFAASSSSGVRAKSKWRKVSLSSYRTRLINAYWLSMRCPSTTCPSSCARIAARLASSGRTSINPRLSTIVWLMVSDSSVEVISTRQRTSGWISRLLVTSRLLTTVSSTLSTSPYGASKPCRSRRSVTLSSAWWSQERSACNGV